MDDGDIGMAIPNRTLSRKEALSLRSEGLATNECCLSEELSGRGDCSWWQEFSGKPQGWGMFRFFQYNLNPTSFLSPLAWKKEQTPRTLEHAKAK